MNHLEQLVAEWLEFRGYFVRQSVRVGPREKGGFEGELDVVGFSPPRNHLIHIECSLDADGWKARDEKFARKFQCGRTYVPNLFAGLNLPAALDQAAVLMFIPSQHPPTIGGARLISSAALVEEIRQGLKSRKLNSGIVPETMPLLRTLHLAFGSKASTAVDTLIPVESPLVLGA